MHEYGNRYARLRIVLFENNSKQLQRRQTQPQIGNTFCLATTYKFLRNHSISN